MAFQQEEGKISVFKNTDKTADKHPDFNGSFTLNGTTVKFALWNNVSKKNGLKYLAGNLDDGSYEKKDKKQEEDDDFWN